MQKFYTSLRYLPLLLGSTILLSACNINKNRFNSQKNLYAPHAYNQPAKYKGLQLPKLIRKNKEYRNGIVGRLRGEKKLMYQKRAPGQNPFDQFQRWIETEPQYLLYPG